MNASKWSKIEYSQGDKRYVGLFLQDEIAQPKAIVVLLPDWRGQGELAKDHATYLASLGCAVLIADLYGEGFNPTSPDQVGPMVKHLLDHRTEGAAALSAAVRQVRQTTPVDTPIVCLGYSAGGMIALDYARSGGVAAGVILCSALLKTAEEGMATAIRSPVLILQGTQDQVSPMQVIADVVAEMDEAKNDVRIELYTQTHHAFDNPEAGSDPSARLVYSERSARRARQLIAEFITEVCKTAS